MAEKMQLLQQFSMKFSVEMWSKLTVLWEEKRSSSVVVVVVMVVAAVKPPHSMATLQLLCNLTLNNERERERERKAEQGRERWSFDGD